MEKKQMCIFKNLFNPINTKVLLRAIPEINV